MWMIRRPGVSFAAPWSLYLNESPPANFPTQVSFDLNTSPSGNYQINDSVIWMTRELARIWWGVLCIFTQTLPEQTMVQTNVAPYQQIMSNRVWTISIAIQIFFFNQVSAISLPPRQMMSSGLWPVNNVTSCSKPIMFNQLWPINRTSMSPSWLPRYQV